MARSFGRVAIWGEVKGLLLSCDRFSNINNIAKMLKTSSEGGSQVTEMSGLVGVIIWGETDGVLPSRDSFTKIGQET